MTAHYPDLAGRGVFISGGASGIGADFVAAFHRQGARVWFIDIAEADGQALAAALGEETGTAPRFQRVDVTDEAALAEAITAAEAWAPVDVLINNAANDRRMDLFDAGPAEWSQMVDVNLRHQFFAAQAAARAMIGRGRGAIINLGSVAPEAMVANLALYQMCKSAVRGLTRALARDLGAHGVRVNAILPGAVLTEKQRRLWYQTPEAVAEMVGQQCLKRPLAGADVAAMALFLASDVAAGCTAQDFIVDGGLV